jgi:hypothetical protein
MWHFYKTYYCNISVIFNTYIILKTTAFCLDRVDGAGCCDRIMWRGMQKRQNHLHDHLLPFSILICSLECELNNESVCLMYGFLCHRLYFSKKLVRSGLVCSSHVCFKIALLPTNLEVCIHVLHLQSYWVVFIKNCISGLYTKCCVTNRIHFRLCPNSESGWRHQYSA